MCIEESYIDEDINEIEYSIQERGQMIIEDCLKEKVTDPVRIFRNLANKEYIRIHGPEHHILDGASVLTAFYNAGGNIDLRLSLERLAEEGELIPGGICGLWGVCGSVASIGAALAILDGTEALSTDDSWGNHMKFTSKTLESMSKIGGPRCCKRNAFISFRETIKFINENYDVELPISEIKCGYSKINEECIKERCPFNVEKNI